MAARPVPNKLLQAIKDRNLARVTNLVVGGEKITSEHLYAAYQDLEIVRFLVEVGNFSPMAEEGKAFLSLIGEENAEIIAYLLTKVEGPLPVHREFEKCFLQRSATSTFEILQMIVDRIPFSPETQSSYDCALDHILIEMMIREYEEDGHEEVDDHVRLLVQKGAQISDSSRYIREVLAFIVEVHDRDYFEEGLSYLLNVSRCRDVENPDSFLSEDNWTRLYETATECRSAIALRLLLDTEAKYPADVLPARPQYLLLGWAASFGNDSQHPNGVRDTFNVLVERCDDFDVLAPMMFGIIVNPDSRVFQEDGEGMTKLQLLRQRGLVFTPLMYALARVEASSGALIVDVSTDEKFEAFLLKPIEDLLEDESDNEDAASLPEGSDSEESDD